MTTSSRSRLTSSQAQRRAEVVRLRSARLSFAEIGRRLDITPQRAGQLYKEALAQIPRLAVEEHRASQLEMIDLAVRHLLTIATASATPAKVKVDAWAAIKGFEERRSKLLGTDAPSKHEVISLDAIDAEIIKLQAALAGGT